MWAARETLMGRREIRTEFWWGNLKERDNFVNLGVHTGIVLKCMRKLGWETVDRIDVSEYRMWRAVVYKEVNLSGTRKKARKFLSRRGSVSSSVITLLCVFFCYFVCLCVIQ